MRFLLLSPRGAAPTFISSQYVTKVGGSTFFVGTNFRIGMTATVNIGGTVTFTSVTVPTDGGSFATATLPAGSYTPGNYDLTLTNPDGQSVTSVGGFTVFGPSTISGLMWDFDASAGVSTSGSLVTTWVDQSANAYTLSASGSNRPTLTTNALGTNSSIDGDGIAAWMLSTGNITQSTKSVTVFAVMKVPSTSANSSVIFEQTNNSKAGSSVNGYRVEYNTSGPQLDVSSGTSSGASLNEVYAIVGPSLNSGYAVYAFVFNRAATYPVTIIGGNPAFELTNVAGAFSGQGLITDGTSASNYDTAPLSIFARNVSAAASAPSKASIVRLFAYNTALTQTTIQNVVYALESQYATDPTPATAQLLVVGDSISSVFDTAGSLSWSTYIYAAPNFYDNLHLDISAISGWTAGNAYTNRVSIFTPRRSDVPCDAVIWLGTNDFATNDTQSPGDLYANTLALLIDYVHGLSSPAIRTILVCTMLPRNVVSAGTAATFEAKRVGKDTSGNALAGRQQNHAYVSTTPDWILINDGSGNPTLFRCTTSGTTANNAGPAYSFTLAATTTDGTAVFTCYGRPYNDLINDAANQSSHHYTAVNLGDPTTPLGTFANTNNTTYYLSDKIHPQATYQTGQTTPSSPSGPPFANSILAAFVPYLKQGGTLSRTYFPPTITGCTGIESGNSNVAKGSPFTAQGTDFGELDATHPLQVSDGTTSFDCTSVTRISDVKLSAIAPASIAVGGPYAVTYKRVDGQTATGGSIIIIPQPSITGVAVGSLSSASSETIDRHVLNPLTIKIYVNNGGGYGATAATFGGVSLTSVTYSADGSVVTGTLPVGTYTAGTTNVSVTSPSTPTALANGSVLVNLLDPSTIWSSTVLRGWFRGDSVQGSGTATSWTDKSTIGNNLTSIGGAPTINTASSIFLQNGVGLQTVTLNGTSDRFLRPNPTFSMGGSTPVPCSVGAIMQFGATSSNNGRIARYSTTGGALGIGTVSSGTKKPVLDVTWTSTWPTAFTTPFSFYGHCNGATVSTGGIAVNGATEQTGSGSMTGGGITTGGLFAIGYDAGSAFCGGEVSEVITINKEMAASEARQWAIYAANYHGVVI